MVQGLAQNHLQFGTVCCACGIMDCWKTTRGRGYTRALPYQWGITILETVRAKAKGLINYLGSSCKSDIQGLYRLAVPDHRMDLRLLQEPFFSEQI